MSFQTPRRRRARSVSDLEDFVSSQDKHVSTDLAASPSSSLTTPALTPDSAIDGPENDMPQTPKEHLRYSSDTPSKSRKASSFRSTNIKLQGYLPSIEPNHHNDDPPQTSDKAACSNYVHTPSYKTNLHATHPVPDSRSCLGGHSGDLVPSDSVQSREQLTRMPRKFSNQQTIQLVTRSTPLETRTSLLENTHDAQEFSTLDLDELKTIISANLTIWLAEPRKCTAMTQRNTRCGNSILKIKKCMLQLAVFLRQKPVASSTGSIIDMVLAQIDVHKCGKHHSSEAKQTLPNFDLNLKNVHRIASWLNKLAGDIQDKLSTAKLMTADLASTDDLQQLTQDAYLETYVSRELANAPSTATEDRLHQLCPSPNSISHSIDVDTRTRNLALTTVQQKSHLLPLTPLSTRLVLDELVPLSLTSPGATTASVIIIQHTGSDPTATVVESQPPPVRDALPSVSFTNFSQISARKYWPLHLILLDRLYKPLTKRERKPGWVYAFRKRYDLRSYVKIGMTSSVKSSEERLKNLSQRCNIALPTCDEWTEWQSQYAERLEALVHAELAAARREMQYCHCKAKHREWFELGHQGLQHEHVIKVVEKWRQWLNTEQRYLMEGPWTLMDLPFTEVIALCTPLPILAVTESSDCISRSAAPKSQDDVFA